MKHLLLILVVHLTTMYSCFAQFDEKFYSPSQEWSEIDHIPFEEMIFHIEKDTLHTVLFKSSTTPKATIIYYHVSGGNISTNASVAKLLCDDGFQVFMIDFRGYGKSTGKPTHVNIAHDAQFILDEIMDKEEFKNYPVVVYGASMGTQIAAKITRNNKEVVAALVLDGTISSFTDMALLSAPEAQKKMILTYVTSPYSAAEDVKYIGSVPKLFIHSEGDRSVPFAQGKTVFENATEPKVFWKYDGNHLDAASKFREEYLRRINVLLGGI